MYYAGAGTRNAVRIIAVTIAVLLTGVLVWTMLSRSAAGARDTRGQLDIGASTNPAPIGGVGESAQPTANPPGVEPGQSGQPGAPSGGQDGGDGDGEDGGDDGGGQQVVEIAPSPKDCLSYDPAKLTITNAGASGWYLKSGTHSLALFDTHADAANGVKVARRHTKACYIGRGNDRPVPYDFITRYWEGNSGLPLGTAPTLDCQSYDKADLTLKKDEGVWTLISAGEALAAFDTVNDAYRGREVAKNFTKLCYIGRGNDRPVPSRYIIEHWRV